MLRHAAAEVLIACIQSSHVKQMFLHICSKSLSLQARTPITAEATKNLHEIFEFLLSLLPSAVPYADSDQNGTQRLVSYFHVLKTCLISRDEKLMVRKNVYRNIFFKQKFFLFCFFIINSFIF